MYPRGQVRLREDRTCSGQGVPAQRFSAGGSSFWETVRDADRGVRRVARVFLALVPFHVVIKPF